MELTHQVREQLKRLRLSGVVETLSARERQAIEGKWSYVDFLNRLLQDELERRAQKQLALRVRRSNVTSTKTLEGFDFSFNPSSTEAADLGAGERRVFAAQTQCADLRSERGGQDPSMVVPPSGKTFSSYVGCTAFSILFLRFCTTMRSSNCSMSASSLWMR
jgi:hypothetical protein